MNSKDININENGFREYDARWLYPKDINLGGIKNLGIGLGTQITNRTKKNPRVIIGHDYRSYSEEIKKSLTEGLMLAGCQVEDVGLSLSPMVYFAQFELNADGVAMVTASHNENGWTGVKMGIEKGLTHAPEEMNELKDIVLNQKFKFDKGSYKEIKGFKEVYINNLISKNKIQKKIKAGCCMR
jgi:phosphomannomutase / phosphoglucomutase